MATSRMRIKALIPVLAIALIAAMVYDVNRHAPVKVYSLTPSGPMQTYECDMTSTAKSCVLVQEVQ